LLLPAASEKIIERIIVNRLNWYLEENHILNPEQSGFRAGHSTEDNEAKLQNAINKAKLANSHLLAVFIDFEKAYDMARRTGILIKLKKYGIIGRMLAYINNFLSDTCIAVQVDGCFSRLKMESYKVQCYRLYYSS